MRGGARKNLVVLRIHLIPRQRPPLAPAIPLHCHRQPPQPRTHVKDQVLQLLQPIARRPHCCCCCCCRTSATRGGSSVPVPEPAVVQLQPQAQPQHRPRHRLQRQRVHPHVVPPPTRAAAAATAPCRRGTWTRRSRCPTGAAAYRWRPASRGTAGGWRGAARRGGAS